MVQKLSDKAIKKKMQPRFHEHYQKYYPVKTLRDFGYERYICKNCGKGFWSRTPRDYCDEPLCSDGYRFINRDPSNKQLSYREAWEAFAKELGKHGYEEIRRYPVVSRWYDDLYFTTASINDFQPYVVKGEAKPPANPLVVPQFCLRFPDIQLVGLTGRHYTGFIMPGQHAFKHKFSKAKGLRHIFNFITSGLGLEAKDIVFHEDIWSGGGNFGPCLEYFSGGLELGNQVYMEFEQTNDGFKELDFKVLDHGGGLERYAWFTQATPTSYDAVFPYVLERVYNRVNIHPSVKWEKIGRYMAYFEQEKGWHTLSKKTGLSLQELKDEILPIKDIYVLVDHTRALLFAIIDGALPSNVGGGHNLRNILRRCFYIIEKRDFDLSVKELLRWHIEDLGDWFTELRETTSLFDIINVEKQRFKKSKQQAEQLLGKTKNPSIEKMLELYDTHGVQPEVMREKGWEVPEDFYERLSQLHEEKQEIENHKEVDVEGIQKTKKLYYSDEYQKKFRAKILKVIGDWVVLDKTIFYPSGGGQESDKGEIEGKRVVNVKMENDVILHKIPKGDFKKGERIKGQIDWKRRYQLMKNHSATHLVNWAARKVLGDHVWQAGAKKTFEKARIDLTHYQSLTFEEIQEIEQLANQKVGSDIKIVKKVLPRTQAEKKYGFRLYQGGAVPGKKLRVVKTGEEVEACGGTHLDRTSEIGLIKIINSERIQDGVVRLEFVTDENAIEIIQDQERILKKLSNLWDIPYDQLPSTGKRFFREWKDRGKKIDVLEEEVIELKIKEAIKHKEPIVEIEVPGSFGKIAKHVQKYKTEIDNTIILLGKNYGYGVSSNEIDVKQKMEKIFEKVQGNEKEAKGFKKQTT